MQVNRNEIEKYIPQRAPFIMIDELIEARKESFTSSFVISEDQVLLNGNIASEGVLIENIAQTCAAGFGYLSQFEEQSAPKTGFIGAISKIEVYGQANAGDQLQTHVSVLSTFENIHLIEGKVSCKEVELLKCQMKIVQA